MVKRITADTLVRVKVDSIDGCQCTYSNSEDNARLHASEAHDQDEPHVLHNVNEIQSDFIVLDAASRKSFEEALAELFEEALAEVLDLLAEEISNDRSDSTHNNLRTTEEEGEDFSKISNGRSDSTHNNLSTTEEEGEDFCSAYFADFREDKEALINCLLQLETHYSDRTDMFNHINHDDTYIGNIGEHIHDEQANQDFLSELSDNAINDNAIFFKWRTDMFNHINHDDTYIGNIGEHIHDEQANQDFLSELSDNAINDSNTAVEYQPAAQSDIEGPPVVFVKRKDLRGSSFTSQELPCLHLFHDECIIHWLDIQKSCPTCRFELDAAETI
ncbi:hypothetical protein KP509_19G062700 [Ceratopteris richardii]|uniref:RING-type domain-containing protein n=1 Tax=Ceratopteris richardii TaxID=49495 RepID=A0A8T2SMX6_CERRI|nr:hypothetical protein KP509_19G062700 [Ceratopteris richardii]